MKIPCFYSDEQIHNAASFSKSPMKPGLIARKVSLDPDFRMLQSLIDPIGSDRIARVHDEAHVKAVVAGEKGDGFGNKSKIDNRAIRATVGNFVVAAEYAGIGKLPGSMMANIQHPGVVWSLTSGFHHAGYDFCGGYCTFNALTIAAFELQKFRGIKTLIVDEDAHYGNGCINVISHLSMADYCHYMQSKYTHQMSGENSLIKFTEELESQLLSFKPNLIMYQAGADNWAGDPLGGGMTMDQLFMRDRAVFILAKRHNIPVVVNLAGGYAEDFDDTIAIHMNTAEAMKEIYLGKKPNPVYPEAALKLEEEIKNEQQ